MPDPPPISVRRLRAADRARWDELWAGYIAFYRGEVTDAISDLTFTRLCDAAEGMLGLVAVDAADWPVGLAHLVFHPSTWATRGYCYLEDLFVDPDQRGGTVATRLFAAIDEHARERGAERIYWHTQSFNGPARSLYDTVGQLTSFVVYQRPVD